MKQEEEKPEVIQTIHLSENGDVTLDGRPVETEALATMLSDTSSVRITAHGKVRTELLIKVIDECNKTGVRNGEMDYGGGLVLPIEFEVPSGSEK